MIIPLSCLLCLEGNNCLAVNVRLAFIDVPVKTHEEERIRLCNICRWS